MKAAEIVTIIASGAVVATGAVFGGLALGSIRSDEKRPDEIPVIVENDDDKDKDDSSKKTEEETLKVGRYTVHYGTYEGTEEDYDGSKVVSRTLTLKLTKDTITFNNGEPLKYTVSGSQLKIIGAPVTVIGNDKIRVDAGSGVDYKWKGN